MVDPEIREATLDDVPAIRRIGERTWRAAYGDVLDPETIDAAMAEWYDPESLRDQVARTDVGYYVAETRSVVGFVSGGSGEEEGVAVLGSIYVHPDHWGEGFGSELLSTFEAFCVDRVYDAIQLWVLAENDRARSFYREHGYEKVDEREVDLFGERVRDCEFRKDLERTA